MWQVNSRPAPWLKISHLSPIEVLDDYDGPRLFTVATDDGQTLLAYQCGDEPSLSRYLLVPANERLIHGIKANKVTLRDALTSQGWAFLVDRLHSYPLSVVSVDPNDLPSSALPKPGVRLSIADNALLRVRMIGKGLVPGHVPASVIKKLVDGVTGAVRTLSARALSVDAVAGRPADYWRQYYDLPAIEFGFRSFEIAFGSPDVSSGLALETPPLKQVEILLAKGLAWATDRDTSNIAEMAEWPSIVDALAKLAPPQKGIIEEVEISGTLAGRRRKPARLTRISADRIAAARKLVEPDKQSRTYEGFVREFDKDKLTFILRDKDGRTVCYVGCTPDQYEDVYLAFDSDKLVNIVVYESTSPVNELVSITFSAPSAKIDKEDFN